LHGPWQGGNVCGHDFNGAVWAGVDSVKPYGGNATRRVDRLLSSFEIETTHESIAGIFRTCPLHRAMTNVEVMNGPRQDAAQVSLLTHLRNGVLLADIDFSTGAPGRGA
jgi:hypothetical protein